MEKEIKILLIEDDRQISRQVQTYLQKRNYAVEIVSSCHDALNRPDYFYDVALVDIHLPDGSAEPLIAKLKEKGIRVIVTTVKNDESFIVKTLDKGADDFLTKPFSLEILRARIDAAVRTIALIEDRKIIYRELVLDTTRARITYRDQEVELTSLEYALLSLFIKNPNRVFTRGQLLERFWENRDRIVNDNTLTAVIKRIRGKTSPDLIVTVRGIGYRMG
ncbi:MAG: response regulator transcription factor [Peptostreptococcaceae bacterium]|nr:response regulator transcription factor [Peptostreptococcaceae bacterium]